MPILLFFSFVGWTPQTFTSSRKNRAEVNKQSIYSFLDEDELKVLSLSLLKFHAFCGLI
jgi:Protein of unknown function (DUF1604)